MWTRGPPPWYSRSPLPGSRKKPARRSSSQAGLFMWSGGDASPRLRKVEHRVADVGRDGRRARAGGGERAGPCRPDGWAMGTLVQRAWRTRHWLSSWAGLAVAGLAVLALGMGLWLNLSGRVQAPGAGHPGAHGLGPDALPFADAPTLIDKPARASRSSPIPCPPGPSATWPRPPANPRRGRWEMKRRVLGSAGKEATLLRERGRVPGQVLPAGVAEEPRAAGAQSPPLP